MNDVARGQSIWPVKTANIEIFSDFKTFTETDGLPSRSIQSLTVNGSHLWVGTDHGLARFDGTEWKTWTATNGLPDDTISSIAVDPLTNDVWLGSWDHGLIRLTGGRFDFFDQFNSGLAGNFVFSLTIHQGKVCAANIGGVSVYDPLADSWELYEPRQADGSHSILTSITRAAGKLYAPTLYGGVKELQFDEGQSNWIDVFLRADIHPSGTRDIDFGKSVGVAFSENGKAMWLATQSALFRKNIEHGAWDKRDFPYAMSQNQYVQCVAASEDGTIWLGTDNGLCVLADWESNTWVHYRYDSGELQGEVSVIDATGIIKTVKPFFSIPDNNIRAIALDRKTAWIGTAKGLVHASNPGPIDIIVSHSPKPVMQYLPLQVEKKTQSYDKNNPTNRFNARPAVAVYGPRNRTITLPGKRINTRLYPDRADMKAVDRCMHQFNKQAKSKDARVELFKRSPGYERYGWGLPEDDLVYFARRANIAGVVGLLDQRHREAAEVVARVEIPFVNVASADGFDHSDSLYNPWIFRCWGDQPRQHRALLDYVVNDLGLARIAMVRTRGRSSQTHLNWWKNHALKQKYSIVDELYYEPNDSNHDDFVEALKKSKPQVILTWADRKMSVELLRQIRNAGLDALVVTSDEIVTDDFAHHVGEIAGRVIALIPESFRTNEKKVSLITQAGYQENSTGAHKKNSSSLYETRSYEATDHMFYAIKMVGKDRRRVKRVLQMMNYSAMGELHYERRHDTSQLTFSRLMQGQWVSQTLSAD